MNSKPTTQSASFRIHSELHYEVLRPSTVLFSIHALSTQNQSPKDEVVQINPEIRWEEIPLEIGENRYVRLDTGTAVNLDVSYSATATTRSTLVNHGEIRETPIAGLKRSAIPYLLPSRYCQSDRLGKLAAKEFGSIPHAYDQAVAVSDWIFENIEYLSGSTDAMTSAFDTVTQRAGVCRDFAHLGIAICRALSIPARYLTAYACNMQPPDFHACFEACIGNRWFVFDPTRLAPLNGLVRIAIGRDAADTSVATIFGNMRLTRMMVSCDSPDFTPLGPGDLRDHAILLEP